MCPIKYVWRRCHPPQTGRAHPHGPPERETRDVDGADRRAGAGGGPTRSLTSQRRPSPTTRRDGVGDPRPAAVWECALYARCVLSVCSHRVQSQVPVRVRVPRSARPRGRAALLHACISPLRSAHVLVARAQASEDRGALDGTTPHRPRAPPPDAFRLL